MTIPQHGVPWRPYCDVLVEGEYDRFVPPGCYAELLGYSLFYTGTSPDDAVFVSIGINSVQLLVIQVGGEDDQTQFTTFANAIAFADESIRVIEAGVGSGASRVTLSVFARLYPLEGLYVSPA